VIKAGFEEMADTALYKEQQCKNAIILHAP